MIMVAVPLIFELAVFGFVIELNQQAEDAAARARDARRINDEINAMIQTIYTMNVLSHGMSLHGLPTMMALASHTPGNPTTPQDIANSARRLKEAEADILEHIDNLKQLEKDNPADLVTVQNTEAAALRARTHVADVMKEVAQTGFENLPAILSRLRGTLDRDLAKVISPELLDLAKRKVSDEQELKAADARKLAQKVLFGAVAMSILLALLVAKLFSDRIASRLAKLRSNAIFLSQRQSLPPRIGGDDEIAELDGSYHEAASLLRDSEDKLQNTFDNAADLICSLNEQLSVDVVNKTSERLFHIKPQDLLGTRFVQFVSESSRKAFFDVIDAAKLQTEPAASAEVQLKNAIGQTFDTVCIPKWVASERTYFCVFHDISERKQAEEIKREVFAMVSHDLRAPVTSFGHFTEMLEDGAFGELNSKGERFLKYATASVSQMQKLLDDVMFLERIKGRSVRVSKTSLKVSEVLANVSDPLRIFAQNKGVLIDVNNEGDNVFSDQTLLEKILSNFLGNAIKVAPANSQVRLAFKVKGTHNVFLVGDDGPGIEEDKISRLFDRFYSDETKTTEQSPSSGLGLTIAKELADLIGARIEVESEIGVGTTFNLLLEQQGYDQ